MGMTPANEEYDVAPPRADAMIESLRAFGYDLSAAIADLVDNSISAGAKNIWIVFRWEGIASSVSIRDDGHGMSEGALVDAMRPGSQNPLEPRDACDLGRFGLGLKTASFSQCRRLVVLSRPEGAVVAVRCWDLDYVAASDGEWRLLKGVDLGPATLMTQLKRSKSGTIVLWEKLDRVTGKVRTDDEAAHRRFLDALDEVKQHLSMVFHRFLEAGRLKIWLNERAIQPWDPFLTTAHATQVLAAERLPFSGSHINIQPYVLPHHSKIDPETHKRAAGPRGWNAQQGFYVYRNRRLLVAGDWLGLGFQKEEHFKLARILIDLPNTMDADWEIDVKKSTARPPGVLRRDLKRIATATRARACEIYRHRGKVVARQTTDSSVFVWEKKVRRGKIYYEINRRHPLIQQLVESSNGTKGRILVALRLIEETVPVAYIALNNAENPDGHALPFDAAPPKELISLLKDVVVALLLQGMSRQDARRRISVMEPFDRYPELIEAEFELGPDAV